MTWGQVTSPIIACAFAVEFLAFATGSDIFFLLCIFIFCCVLIAELVEMYFDGMESEQDE